MNARVLFSVVVSVMLALACAGCKSDSSQGTVHGTVTLDGAPLASGIVRFVPADGRTATSDATIADGKFTANVPVGEKRVTISAPKVVGKRKMYETPDSPMVDVIEELLPARYNLRSELSITVSAGSQEAEYPLTSAK
jgi:hypothetical protein